MEILGVILLVILAITAVAGYTFLPLPIWFIFIGLLFYISRKPKISLK